MMAALWAVGFCAAANAANPLNSADILILVNANSPVSRSIADDYRRFYRDITDAQVLYLGGNASFPSGLPDSAAPEATPASEIITRQQFESLIAQPVRDYLVSTGMVNTIYCIITTAGIPYRIEDTSPALADAIFPAGSNAYLVMQNRSTVNAASVESELAVVFQIDPQLTPAPTGPGVPIAGRVVNPYHGYRSGIKAWQGVRDILGRRTLFQWNFSNLWPISLQPRIEGAYSSAGCSSKYRKMSPADLYLVARLDGPHEAGVSPIFAVHEMLVRAAAASNPNAFNFVGYNPATGFVVLDHSSAPCTELANTNSYNFPRSTSYLTYEANPVPPGSEAYTSPCQRGGGNHYKILVKTLSGQDAPAGITTQIPFTFGLQGNCLWDDTLAAMNQANLPVGSGAIGLLTYGRNGCDGRPSNYLLTAGPGGGPLLRCSPGAVFSSIESFNAVTMFTDTATTQAKIAEFILMGGTAAVGHAFEPAVDAAFHDEFLISNLLRDDDSDGVADLTLAEAAASATPYVSWSEVLIGDPLLRLQAGPGGLVSTSGCATDFDRDTYTGFTDLMMLLDAYNTVLGDPLYNPAADVDRDGCVGFVDLMGVLDYYNTACPSQ